MNEFSYYSDSDDESEYSLDEVDDVLYDEEDYVVERQGNNYCRELKEAVGLKIRMFCVAGRNKEYLDCSSCFLLQVVCVQWLLGPMNFWIEEARAQSRYPIFIFT